MSLPLDGVKVLDFTAIMAGPYCTLMLADMGADVTKVETFPEGDGSRRFEPKVNDESYCFAVLNRNKKSVALDMKQAEGKEIFLKLAAQTDILVENFRPGVTKKLGIDYESIKKINPGVIYASISGFGQTGPYGKKGGFDIIAGRSGSGSLATLASQQLTGLRNELLDMARAYDCVVMDMGAGIDRVVRQLAGPAGTTLVVTTDEPTSITDAYAFIKVTRATNPQADIRIVVNLAQNVKEGERTYNTILKACQNFLKFQPPLAGIVRRDIKVREAIRHQVPLLIRSPTCDAARDVEAVAQKLFTS